MFRLEGIYPALVTPFTDNKSQIDEERLRNLVNYCVELGVNGLTPCGTTGEFVNLSIEERKLVIKTVVDATNSRVPVIAGAGGSGTDEALEMVKYVKDVGADAALVVTPFYLKPANRGIYQHYYKIATSVELPIILYNIPQCTGVWLSWQMVEDLADMSNIVGLKDSSCELKYILAVLEKVRDKINVMCGCDEVVLPALAAGASGAILASANFIGDVWVKLYRAFENGKLEEAREMQYRIQKLARIITSSGAVGTKEALNMIGVEVGSVRLPLSTGGELSYENREELRLELEKLGKIKPKLIKIEYEGKVLEERFTAVGITPEMISDFNLRVGESLAGEEPEVAHIELVMGKREGPVGEAYAKAKSTPAHGHEPLLAVLEPNLMVKPITLIIPTVTIKSMRQASVFYGSAQAAVAKAVADSVADGTIPKKFVEELIIIANVFIHPASVNRHRIYINNYKAMRHALRKAIESRPNVEEIMENKDRAKHPFKYTP